MTWDSRSDQYARARRMLGHALILDDDPEVWDGLTFVLALAFDAESTGAPAPGRVQGHPYRRHQPCHE